VHFSPVCDGRLPLETLLGPLGRCPLNDSIASRYAPRYDLLLKVAYESLRSPAGSDFSSDLSEGGLQLHTPLPLKVGEKLNLHISFPRFVAPIPVVGEVRWAREDRRVGIAFRRVPRTAEAQLGALVQRCRQKESALPAGVAKAFAGFRPLRVLVLEAKPHWMPLLSEQSAEHAELIRPSLLVKAWQTLWSRGDVALIDLDDLHLPAGEVLTVLRADKRWDTFPLVLLTSSESVALSTFVAGRPNAMVLRKPVAAEQLVRTLHLVGELKNKPVFDQLRLVPSVRDVPRVVSR
jgi:hypothetical protein